MTPGASARPRGFAKTSVSIVLIAGALLALPWFFFVANQAKKEPCIYEINGICYPDGDADNPALTAKWQIIDFDTGKPLQGVWISFSWIDRSRERELGGVCMRNVIGQTDASGRFSNTADSGAWLYSNAKVFKTGYQRLGGRVQNEVVLDVHPVLEKDIGRYGEFEQQLLASGYTLESNAGKFGYSKSAVRDANYERPDVEPGSAHGQIQYWGSARGLPPQLAADDIGELCVNRRIRAYDARTDNADYLRYGLRLAKKADVDGGLDVINMREMLWVRERDRASMQNLCDAKWDTVSAELRFEGLARRLSQLLAAPGNQQKTLSELVPDYLPDATNDSRDPALSKAQRVVLCDYMNLFITK